MTAAFCSGVYFRSDEPSWCVCLCEAEEEDGLASAEDEEAGMMGGEWW